MREPLLAVRVARFEVQGAFGVKLGLWGAYSATVIQGVDRNMIGN